MRQLSVVCSRNLFFMHVSRALCQRLQLPSKCCTICNRNLQSGILAAGAASTHLLNNLLYLAGLGPVLVPLSSVIAGATGVLPPHITAALQSLGPGGIAAPHFANTVPSAPVLPAPTAGQLLQQAAVNQILQQQAAAAAAAAPNQSSAQARATAASTAGRGYAGVGPTSLAALVPHVPSPPHVAGSLAAAVAAAAKSQAPAASAGTAFTAHALHCLIDHVTTAPTLQK